MIYYREQVKEVKQVGYRLCWSSESFPLEELTTHLIVRYRLSSIELRTGRELHTLITIGTFSVPIGTPEGDVLDAVLEHIAKNKLRTLALPPLRSPTDVHATATRSPSGR